MNFLQILQIKLIHRTFLIFSKHNFKNPVQKLFKKVIGKFEKHLLVKKFEYCFFQEISIDIKVITNLKEVFQNIL